MLARRDGYNQDYLGVLRHLSIGVTCITSAGDLVPGLEFISSRLLHLQSEAAGLQFPGVFHQS